ncbi:MAG: hypothetical protein ACFFB3_22560, partial [Candidatus Hodarchaeota archaeon]
EIITAEKTFLSDLEGKIKEILGFGQGTTLLLFRSGKVINNNQPLGAQIHSGDYLIASILESDTDKIIKLNFQQNLS